MKNGNGRRRSVVRWVVAVTGTLVISTLMFPPLPATAIVPDTPCNQKCLADYEEEAVKCGKIKENEEAYTACHNKAYERYKSCRGGCKKVTDCKELCKQLCEEIHRLCSEKCKKPECYEKCTNELGACMKKCDKECG